MYDTGFGVVQPKLIN